MKEEIQILKFMEISVVPGRTINAELVKVPIQMLKLDPNNVRFRHLQNLQSEQEMEEAIIKERDTTNLLNEIKYSAGLQNPIVIDSNFIVREGERRLVCCRDIINDPKIEESTKSKFRMLPCIKLPENTNPKDIGIYLARVHVGGNKPWRAFNQAAHIFDLHEKYGTTLEEIRKSLSMGKIRVKNTLDSYKLLSEYADKFSSLDKDWVEKYSYFLEFFKKRSKIKYWIDSRENQEKFMEWVKEGKFLRGEDVRDLPYIVGNKEALKIFESQNGNHSKTMDFLSKTNPILGNKLYKMLDKITVSLIENRQKEIFAASRSRAKLRMLKELKEVLDHIIENIES